MGFEFCVCDVPPRSSGLLYRHQSNQITHKADPRPGGGYPPKKVNDRSINLSVVSGTEGHHSQLKEVQARAHSQTRAIASPFFQRQVGAQVCFYRCIFGSMKSRNVLRIDLVEFIRKCEQLLGWPKSFAPTHWTPEDSPLSLLPLSLLRIYFVLTYFIRQTRKYLTPFCWRKYFLICFRIHYSTPHPPHTPPKKEKKVKRELSLLVAPFHFSVPVCWGWPVVNHAVGPGTVLSASAVKVNSLTTSLITQKDPLVRHMHFALPVSF